MNKAMMGRYTCKPLRFFLLAFACHISLAFPSPDWRISFQENQHTQLTEAIRQLELWALDNEKKQQAIDGEGYFRLIQLYLKSGKTVNAKLVLEQFSQLRNKLSSDAILWLELSVANIYLAEVNTKKAKEVLHKIQEDARAGSQLIRMYHHYLSGRQKSLSSLYEEALFSFNQARDIAKQVDDSHFNMAVLSQLVNIMYYMERYHESLATNSEMTQLSERHGDEFFAVFSLSNAMNIYYMLSVEQGSLANEEINKNATDEERAKALAQQSEYFEISNTLRDQILEKAATIGAFRPLLRALIQLQNKHLSDQNALKAVEVAEKTIAFAEMYHSDYEKAVSYNNISIALRSIEKYKDALAALDKADEIYKRLDHKQSMLWALEDYSIIYQLMGDYEKSLDYHSDYHTESMNQIRRTNSEKVLELQEIFENEKKIREIERLNQENLLSASKIESQRIITIFSIVFVIFVAFSFFIMLSRSKIITRKNEELDILNQKLKVQALHDPLTKLHNRRFVGEIQEKLARTVVRREKNRDNSEGKIGLVLMDIDYFKRINDTHGHAIGDEVLVAISEELSGNLRGGDIAVRWGGEEFLIILFDTNFLGVQKYCERIITLRNSGGMKTSSGDINVTLSMGCALFPFSEGDPQWLSWDESVKLVDNLLYIAKEMGRNRALTIDSGNSGVSEEAKNLVLNLDTQIDEELLSEHGFSITIIEP